MTERGDVSLRVGRERTGPDLLVESLTLERVSFYLKFLTWHHSLSTEFLKFYVLNFARIYKIHACKVTFFTSKIKEKIQETHVFEILR